MTLRERVEKIINESFDEKQSRINFCRKNPLVAQRCYKNLTAEEIEAITLGMFEKCLRN
jgi:hypothetical protein